MTFDWCLACKNTTLTKFMKTMLHCSSSGDRYSRRHSCLWASYWSHVLGKHGNNFWPDLRYILVIPFFWFKYVIS